MMRGGFLKTPLLQKTSMIWDTAQVSKFEKIFTMQRKLL
jgi:hypothetical protein